MRQRLSLRKAARYGKRLGLGVVAGLARGNTDHRVDLRTRDGQWVSYWPKTDEFSVFDTGNIVSAHHNLSCERDHAD